MLTLRPASLVAAAVLTGLSLTAIPISSALQDDDPPAGLRPILPPDSDRSEDPAPAAPFEAEAWRAKLTDADLDRRESAFEDAAARLGRDPALREWVEQAAEGSGELAWTARLLLREGGRAGGGPRGLVPFGGRDARGRDPFGFDPFQGFGRSPFGGWPFGGGGSVFDALDELWAAPGGADQREGLSLRYGPDGVEVEVRRDVDGEPRVETFRAEDLESLLEAHPELRDSIGAANIGRRFGRGGFGVGTPRQPTVLRTDILGVRVAQTDPDRGEPAGLLVFDTELGTVAHLLGVGRGDVLVELNGRPLREVSDISEVLANRPEGGELRLRWIDRNGVETTRVWRPGAADDVR